MGKDSKLNLVLDIGHHRIKWALFDQSKIQLSGTFKGQLNVAGFDQAWSKIAIPGLIMGCNVGGEAIAQQLNGWFQDHWNMTPHWLSVADGQYRLLSSYKDLSELGVDRWAAALGVMSLKCESAIIVDCGSAITVDSLDAGVFHANAILPGLMMQLSALADLVGTEREHTSLQKLKQHWPADSTEQGIINGVLVGVAAAIDYLIIKSQQQMMHQAVVYLTGGDAETIMPLLESEVKLVPNLVLQGLYFALEQSCVGW